MWCVVNFSVNPVNPPASRRTGRHQRPPPAEQADHQRIQGTPVCGDDVQEDAAVRGHDLFKYLPMAGFARAETGEATGGLQFRHKPLDRAFTTVQGG